MSTVAPDEIDPFVPPDEKLWVNLDCSCGEKVHFLIGSAHTHPGRMWAWCPSRQKHMMISKSEIVACFRESSYWIAGFLHGNAPSCPTAPGGGYLPDDDARVQRWREAVQDFPETGLWLHYERECEECGEALLPTRLTERCAACTDSAG